VGGTEVVNPIALRTTMILRLEGGVWKSFQAVFLSAPVNESKFELFSANFLENAVKSKVAEDTRIKR
jgi:hypothetical protein